MSVEIPLDLLIELAIIAASIGGMWMLFKAELVALRKQVEEHSPDVRKINPLETRFDAFKDEVDRRLTGIERKVDEVHTLLLRAAAVSALPQVYNRS